MERNSTNKINTAALDNGPNSVEKQTFKNYKLYKRIISYENCIGKQAQQYNNDGYPQNYSNLNCLYFSTYLSKDFSVYLLTCFQVTGPLTRSYRYLPKAFNIGRLTILY